MTWVHMVLLALVLAGASGPRRARTDGRMWRLGQPAAPGADGSAQRGSRLAAGLASPSSGGPAAGAPGGGADAPPGGLADAPTVAGSAGGPGVLGAQDVGEALGSRATLLQFSSAFCMPCRATRLVLADVASTVPGVAHVELDAESNLDLVRRLGVTRTPTVLVLDGSGRIRVRATGAPRRVDVLAALGDVV